MEYIEFASSHWELTLGFCVTLLMLGWNIFGDKIRGITSLSPQEVIQLINKENPLLLDVREDKELATMGKIPNAVHLALRSVKDKIGAIESDKSRAVIAVCRNGARSGSACASLKKQGFKRVYNLTGGVVAWQKLGLPLVSK